MSRGYREDPWECPDVLPDGSFIVQSAVPGSKKLGFTQQIFGPSAGFLTSPTEPPLELGLVLDARRFGNYIGARPWLVSVQSIETIRTGDDLAPLSDSDILSQGRRYSVLQAKISWQDGTAGQREVFVDIAGGITMHMFAQNVTVEALIPRGSTVIDRPNIEVTLDNPLDALVSARIAPTSVERMEATAGYNFTVQVNNPDGASFQTPIPPGARWVSIYQSTGPATPFYEWAGLAASPGKGRITPDINGNVDRQTIPNVPYIQAAAVGAPRYCTFVYRVFP